MANKLLTVRAAYLYIFMGSMLLGGLILFVAYKTFGLLYSHFASNSEAFVVRLAHWLINHVGKTPIAILLFLAVFILMFMLRSQKTADDVKALLKAAEELVRNGSFQKLEVASAGELQVLAEHLRGLNEKAGIWQQRDETAEHNVEEKTARRLGNEDIMALVLRIKSLQRIIDEADRAETEPEQAERLNADALNALRREALGMERLLESLIAAP